MSDVVIRVENVSKRYRLGAIGSWTLREDIHRTWARVFGKPDPVAKVVHSSNGNSQSSASNPLASKNIWALRDISFEVRQGEVVGIIGRNGAGKSTLLKILSRITAPTGGVVKVKGRIASLLEVGTGFHPELTGRENIYLNGTILGMRKGEIGAKFDEIVAFAEIEKFIDTPVKRYSSGMYVRLAFAVAAHLEPEILLVDEVLAVGDVAFQKKCLGKIGDVAKQGRTVLFVSHNMGAITQLCERAILIAGGVKSYDGLSAQAVSLYLESGHTIESRIEYDVDGSLPMQFTAFSIESTAGSCLKQIKIAEPFEIGIEYRVAEWKSGAYIALDIFNEAGIRVLWSSDVSNPDHLLIPRSPGNYSARATVPGNVLAPGKYFCSFSFYTPGIHGAVDYRENAISFEIIDNDSLLSRFGIPPPAVTSIPLGWTTVTVN